MGRRGDPTDGGSSDSPGGPRIKKEPGVCEETQAVPGGPADDGSGNEAAEAGRAQSAVRVGGGRCQVKGAKGLELIQTARRSRRKVSNKRPARHNLSFGRPTVEWTKADGRKLGGRKTRTYRLDRGVDHTDQTREREERADEGCQAPFLADRGVTEIGNNGRKQVGSTMEIKGSGTGYSGMLAPTPAASHEPLSASLVDSSRIIQVGTFQRRH